MSSIISVSKQKEIVPSQCNPRRTKHSFSHGHDSFSWDKSEDKDRIGSSSV